MKTFLIFIVIIILWLSIVCASIGCYGRKKYREGYNDRYLEMIREQMGTNLVWGLKK